MNGYFADASGTEKDDARGENPFPDDEQDERDDMRAVLGAMMRQIDLLGWHVKRIRETGSGTVAEEIDGGLENL